MVHVTQAETLCCVMLSHVHVQASKKIVRNATIQAFVTASVASSVAISDGLLRRVAFQHSAAECADDPR